MLMSYFAFTEPAQIAGIAAVAVVISVYLMARASINNSIREYNSQQQRWKDNGEQRVHEKQMQDQRLANEPANKVAGKILRKPSTRRVK